MCCCYKLRAVSHLTGVYAYLKSFRHVQLKEKYYLIINSVWETRTGYFSAGVEEESEIQSIASFNFPSFDNEEDEKERFTREMVLFEK